MKGYFIGIPKKNFRERMLQYWMDNELISERQAWDYYGEHDFDVLCDTCDGSMPLTFKYETNYDGSIRHSECFEVRDNNFVIPTSTINICG